MGKRLPKSETLSYCNTVRHFFVNLKFLSLLSVCVTSEDIIVTTGATQGLHLILSTLIDFSGVIFVDEVTYMIALSAMSQFTTMKIVTGMLKSKLIF